MFPIIVAAVAGGVGVAGAMTASWGDIDITHYRGTNGTASSTVTFTGGGSRPMTITHSIALGGLTVKIGSDPYISAVNGTTIYVTTGTTVTFKYTCYWDSEGPITVTVTDDDNTTTIDTFDCEFTFTG